MNIISAKQIKDDGWEFTQLFIDGVALDQILHTQYPSMDLLGLIPTLLPMNNPRDEPYVWQRILPSKGKSAICPVLMCKDDADLSCILLVAEIENNGKEIVWRRLGIDQSARDSLCLNVDWLNGVSEYRFSVENYQSAIAIFKDDLLDNYMDEQYVAMQYAVNEIYAQGGICTLFSDNIEPVPKRQSLTAHEAASWLASRAHDMKDVVSVHLGMKESEKWVNRSWLDKILGRQSIAVDIFDDIILDIRNLYVAIARQSLKNENLEKHLTIAKPFWDSRKLQELQAMFHYEQEQELLDYVFDVDSLTQEIIL